MSYIITAKPAKGEKGGNRILMIGEEMDYMENGYPRLKDRNVAFPSFMVLVNGEKVPEGETADKPVPASVEVPDEVEVEKWCYTKEDGFFENPDYEEPVAPEADVAPEVESEA